MAHIAHRGSRFAAPVSLALVVILAAACGTAAVSPSPTPAPTPLVTPDPHLADPASAQDVFNGLGRQGLKIAANSAAVTGDGGPIITRINATYDGWPLELVQYRTSADLTKAAAWKDGQVPGKGEPPIALAGANILIRWGPWAAKVKPPVLDDRQTEALDALVAGVDLLLSPLRTRTVVPVRTASAPASTNAGPSAASGSTPAP